MSNIPSPSGSTQTIATSHNHSFSNQPSSRYPRSPNLLPHNPFSPYFPPVQQPVLPPSYPQAYLSSYPYTLQQANDPNLAHEPSDFSLSLPPNQQHSVLPSHTNTSILHQNPYSYEQHPLPPLTGPPPHPYHYGRSSQPFPLYSSTDPNSVTTAVATATSHRPLNPPDVHSLNSHVSSLMTLSKKTPTTPSDSSQTTSPSHNQFSFFSNQPLSRFQKFLKKFKRNPQHAQLDFTRHSFNAPYHTEQSSYQQSFSPHHPRQSYTSKHDCTTTALHSPVSPSPPATTLSGITVSLSAAMQRYVTYLKNVYTSVDTPVYDKEHSLLQVKAKYFINIALVHKHSPKYMIDSDKNEILMDRLHGHVDAIQKKKTNLPVCDVCKRKDGKLARSVLVEGAPGVGKTTFAFELCKQWARGEILQEWPVVVIIKLRDHRTRTAQNMYDLLYHPRPKLKQAVVDELIDQDGKGMLLILDGYDELTDNQRDFNSVIQCLMSRELLCQSTLMVTSRPLVTRTFHHKFVQSIDQHIEVLGFTEKNIEEYIQSACGDKPELVQDFMSYLSCHPFSSALMFNPLQCAIVTDLYRSHWEHGDKGFAPKTLTELYTGLVHILLLRYLTQHPVYKDRYWWISDLSDVPDGVNQQLKAVTALAVKGIRNQQYVFDEVNTNIPSETLGLMQKEEVVASGSGISTSHNFLHLTLQEYLAAVNYSQQFSSPEQLSQLLTRDDLFPLNNFLEHYGKKREPTSYSSATHWPVLLFVAGRTKLSGVPTIIFKTGLHDSDDDDDITTVEVSLLHLLYETQSPQLIQSTLVTSRKYLFASGSSALDWFVIGYCIANSTSTWRVEKKGNDSPSKYFDQLVMGLHLGPEKCSGDCKIGSLHVSGTGNMKILSNLQPYAKSVTEIKLVGNEQKEQHDPEKNRRKPVSEEIPAHYPMLEKITIENVIESSSSAFLLSFISQHRNLHSLSLNQCYLSSIATSSISQFLQSPNNRLHKLTLNNCAIQIPDHTNSVGVSYQLESISPTDIEQFSLEITCSLYGINYLLSQPHQFYANTLTVLKVTVIVSGTKDSLQTSLYPNLVTLEIVSNSNEKTDYLHKFPFNSHEDNLRTLSLMSCHLCNECVRSLIHFLQSSNNKLHKLTLDDCTIHFRSDTNSAAISYQLVSISLTDTGNFSLKITGSLYAINYMLSQPDLFCANTFLKVTIVSGTTDSLQTSLYPNLVTLEILSKSKKKTVYLHRFPLSPHENKLCTLSMTRCHLSVECVNSLTCFLQSPNNRLHKLTLDDCTIQIPDHTNSVAISYQVESISPTDAGNFSLKITSSLFGINFMLSQPLLFYLNHLAILKVVIVNETKDLLQIETSLYPNLNVLEITSEEKIRIYSCDSVISQQNNLRVLSLKRFNLTCDTVRSLIRSLQSSHCGLQELTLVDCISDHTNTIRASSKLKLKSLDSRNVSLEFTGYGCDISRWLSQLSSYAKLSKLILHLEGQDSTSADTLQEIVLYDYILESLKINIDQSFMIYFKLDAIPLPFPRLVKLLQQNNLHTLSLCRCKLNSDVTRSLIRSMQSPHCRLQNLALRKCSISLPEDTQQTPIITKMNIALHSLDISWSVLNQMMSCINPFTQSLTELILHVDNDTHTCTSRVETILQEIASNCPLLETLKIDCDYHISFLPRFIELQQNNLHTLSLIRCNLSSDVTMSLIHLIQSLHWKLQNIALKYCTISLPEDTQQTTAITKTNVALHSLDISWSVLDQMMSCINPFTQSLTELILHIDNDTHTCTSGVETILQEIPSNCPLLKTLKIDGDIGSNHITLPLFIPQFIGSQQSNLHTLSLRRFNLSSDVTRSLIHSLQSPNFKLYKLALCDCIIPNTDHTQLTTAIVSSTTITHLLFIDKNNDTPSLTALASGLKPITRLEQLAVDKLIWSFTEDQFQVLIDAVDSSAVQKLWLRDNLKYKKWLRDRTLSRKNVDIEWYSNYRDLYDKW